jgi:hypothetical protein
MVMLKRGLLLPYTPDDTETGLCKTAHPPSFLCERRAAPLRGKANVTCGTELLYGPGIEKLLVARKAHKRYTSDIRKALAALGAYNC